MIVGVIGKKRSGKDTIANYLVQYYNFQRYAFADPMKVMVKEAFLWNEVWVNGKYKEAVDPRWGISPRQALKHIGTEWAQYGLCESYPEFKEVTDRNLWVKRFIYFYMACKGYNYADQKNFVISDVRFPHEIKTIKESRDLNNDKKVFIKVVRPESEKVTDTHESEKLVDTLLYDYIVQNHGTLQHLQNQITSILIKEHIV